MLWLTTAFFLVSLLAICKAPVYHLWLLSVAVAGLPWLFALMALSAFLGSWFWGSYPVAEMLLSGMAFILFWMPIVTAYRLSGHLYGGIHAAFGEGAKEKAQAKGRIADEKITGRAGESGQTGRKDLSGEKLFDFWKMFSGPLERKIRYRTLTYYSAPGISLTLDFYPSVEKGPLPCVMVIHGGSWSSGDNRQLPELNSRLAREGYHVASINYRLAPEHKSPSPVEDVGSALTYLREHALELRIDPANFVLLGRSAGGQIALLAAYALNDPGIKGVIGFYAPADMVWGYSAPANRLVMDSRKVMEEYLGGTYGEVPGDYRDSSPLEALSAGAIPTLLIHGKKDVLVAYEHSTRLREKLQACGAKNFLLSLPVGTHGFDYVLDGPEGQLSNWCVKYFLKHVTASVNH